MHPPSISILSTSLLLLVASTTALALPAPSRGSYSSKPKGITRCPFNPPPYLPSSALPPPSDGLALKYVVLGRGTQNYTCANSTGAPVAAGAVATLYDVSCLTKTPPSLLDLANNLIPSLFAQAQAVVASIIGSKQSIAQPEVGSHYFQDGTTPVFVLNDGAFIKAQKVVGSPAPAGATGNQYGAPVDWLKLAKKPEEPCGGIEEVYRVATAGGRAEPTCTQPGTITVDYAAEYWMYGYGSAPAPAPAPVDGTWSGYGGSD